MNKIITFKAISFLRQIKFSDFGYVPAIGQVLKFKDGEECKSFVVKSVYAPVPGNFIQVNMEAAD